MFGTLYVIATPIGNREDITLRAIQMLGSVDVLLCEDTRHTGQLLEYIEKLAVNFQFSSASWRINSQFKKPKLISYQEHNEIERIPEVVTLLLEGQNIGLVSDAGTPLISDPGYKLVRECVKHGITIVSIPGASSVVTALIVSGLPTDKFTFLGYLPKKEGKRVKEIEKLRNREIKGTIIFFETKERLRDSLHDIKATMGDVEIVIARELTKVHEEIWRGKVSEAIHYFQNPKGEFVVLIYKHS